MKEHLEIIQDEISSENWVEKKFSFPNNLVRLATTFSGIGAIEHAFQRLGLRHTLVFAGDIDAKVKESYFANYQIREEDWDCVKFSSQF